MSTNDKTDPLVQLRHMADHARSRVPGYAKMLDSIVEELQAERDRAADTNARLNYLRSVFLEEESSEFPLRDEKDDVAGSEAQLKALRAALATIGEFLPS